jgi:hypothetical protein
VDASSPDVDRGFTHAEPNTDETLDIDACPRRNAVTVWLAASLAYLGLSTGASALLSRVFYLSGAADGHHA